MGHLLMYFIFSDYWIFYMFLFVYYYYIYINKRAKSISKANFNHYGLKFYNKVTFMSYSTAHVPSAIGRVVTGTTVAWIVARFKHFVRHFYPPCGLIIIIISGGVIKTKWRSS